MQNAPILLWFNVFWICLLRIQIPWVNLNSSPKLVMQNFIATKISPKHLKIQWLTNGGSPIVLACFYVPHVHSRSTRVTSLWEFFTLIFFAKSLATSVWTGGECDERTGSLSQANCLELSCCDQWESWQRCKERRRFRLEALRQVALRCLSQSIYRSLCLPFSFSLARALSIHLLNNLFERCYFCLCAFSFS